MEGAELSIFEKADKLPTQTIYFIEVTDRKSLLALRGVGPESEAESVRFHGRRVTKVGPEVKHGLPPEGWGPAEQGVREAHLGAAGRFRWRRTPSTGSVS